MDTTESKRRNRKSNDRDKHKRQESSRRCKIAEATHTMTKASVARAPGQERHTDMYIEKHGIYIMSIFKRLPCAFVTTPLSPRLLYSFAYRPLSDVPDKSQQSVVYKQQQEPNTQNARDKMISLCIIKSATEFKTYLLVI
jgi:hypothetical protein